MEYRGLLALLPFDCGCCGIVEERFGQVVHLLKVLENFYGGHFVHEGPRLVNFVLCYCLGYYILLVLSNPQRATDTAEG